MPEQQSTRTVHANGDIIRKLRTARGWTQEKLGSESGDVSAKTVARAEGSGQVYLATIQLIATALGVSPEEITATDQGPPEPILEIFSNLNTGAMPVIIKYAKREGFILVSENDAKEFFFWACARLPEASRESAQEGLLKHFSHATNEPADFTLNITTGRELRSWLEQEIDELTKIAILHLDRYQQPTSEDLQAYSTEIITSDDPLIGYFNFTWSLVEKAIENQSSGVFWWDGLPALFRKEKITQGAVNVIKRLRFILHQVLRSQAILTKEMAHLIAQYALIGIIVYTNITPLQDENKG